MDKILWILLFLTLILFALYTPLNSSRGAVMSFKSLADDYIPLWTPFLIAYISFYFLIVFTFVYFFKKGRFERLKITLLALITAYFLAYLFYWFFQNAVERPVILNLNIFDRTYTWINSWMAPYNAFPSLHVATSTVFAIAFFKDGSKLFKLILFWALFIIASTVLTKQHYFLDIIGGAVLAFFSYWISERLFKKFP